MIPPNKTKSKHVKKTLENPVSVMGRDVSAMAVPETEKFAARKLN
jgi:hypothetical protein